MDRKPYLKFNSQAIEFHTKLPEKMGKIEVELVFTCNIYHWFNKIILPTELNYTYKRKKYYIK